MEKKELSIYTYMQTKYKLTFFSFKTMKILGDKRKEKLALVFFS